MSRLHDMLRQSAAARRGSGVRTSPSRTGNSLFGRMAVLYEKMQNAYEACAKEAGLSCGGCENNCCTSFFQHHTYVEWAYLWRGMQALDKKQRENFLRKADGYVASARQSLAAGLTPSAMCPLNEDGLCALYAHRLMICRMHGTRNMFSLPDGGQRFFPGCSRFTALPCAQSENEGAASACPTLDRTPFYQELAALEMEFVAQARRPMPKVNLTLAEMLVMGPPRLT